MARRHLFIVQADGDSVRTKTAMGRAACALAGIMIAGCASTSAPEYGGRWKAVNRYSERPQAIPLHHAYAFHPSPMDGTLKNMLERWARDSRMSVSYEHPSDFTLYAAIADVHTSDLQQAVSRLSRAYAGQGVVVSVEDNRIVVREVTAVVQ